MLNILIWKNYDNLSSYRERVWTLTLYLVHVFYTLKCVSSKTIEIVTLLYLMLMHCPQCTPLIVHLTNLNCCRSGFSQRWLHLGVDFDMLLFHVLCWNLFHKPFPVSEIFASSSDVFIFDSFCIFVSACTIYLHILL